jgi:putative RecB family exonuclease
MTATETSTGTGAGTDDTGGRGGSAGAASPDGVAADDALERGGGSRVAMASDGVVATGGQARSTHETAEAASLDGTDAVPAPAGASQEATPPEGPATNGLGTAGQAHPTHVTAETTAPAGASQEPAPPAGPATNGAAGGQARPERGTAHVTEDAASTGVVVTDGATAPDGASQEAAPPAGPGTDGQVAADGQGGPVGAGGVTAAPRRGRAGNRTAMGSVSADGVVVAGTLSPSRAGDFMTCPLLYRFRVIDRIPERPSPAAARGTLVHAVLERLFDMPAGSRTPAAALELLGPEWERLLAEEPELATLFEDDGEGETARAEWLTEARGMVERYFSLEDPRRLEPASRELYVETVLESGLLLRGYIDRVDVAPTGEVRVVDYKTGRAPRADFEARALFQMKFYALVLWRLRGTVPRMLQLMYLGNGEILRYTPDEADLRATERKVDALWKAIRRAMETGVWRERTSRLCDWCDHKERCPSFGGEPPPLPEIQPARTTAAGEKSTPRERDDL